MERLRTVRSRCNNFLSFFSGLEIEVELLLAAGGAGGGFVGVEEIGGAVLQVGALLPEVRPAALLGAAAGGVEVEGVVGDFAGGARGFVHGDQRVIDQAALWRAGEVEDGVEEVEALGSVTGIGLFALAEPPLVEGFGEEGGLRIGEADVFAGR